MYITRKFFYLIAFAVISSCGSGSPKESQQTAADFAPAKQEHEGMVWIPGGTFQMGSEASYSKMNERPVRTVSVEGFWMDEHAVTNAEFQKFVEATGYMTTAERPVNWEELKKQLPPGTPKPDDSMLMPGSLVFSPPTHAVDLNDMSGWWRWTPGADWRHPQGPGSNINGMDHFPVVQISWDDAMAYAQWAGKRLPTEAEWEYAAWGGQSGTRYYWGNELKKEGKYMANTFVGDFPYRNLAEDGFAGTAPVKSFPPNGYGLYDMAGNVWHWTADVYNDDSRIQTDMNQNGCQPAEQELLYDSDVRRVTKGGSFLCNPSYCESYRPSARRGTPYDTGMGHIGFRCVAD